MAEDPRELARRLAEEAKSKLKSNEEDPRELARRLAEEAKQRAAAAAPTAPDTADDPPPGKLTAKQALEREREARRQRKAAGVQATAASKSLPPRPAPAPPAAIDEVRRTVDTTVPSETTAPGGMGAVARVIGTTLPSASLVANEPVQPAVARAVWRSHLARAQQEHNAQLAANAAVMLAALERIPEGQLIAARVTVAGKDWAFWVDLSTERLVATAFPADVYLAG